MVAEPQGVLERDNLRLKLSCVGIKTVPAHFLACIKPITAWPKVFTGGHAKINKNKMKRAITNFDTH